MDRFYISQKDEVGRRYTFGQFWFSISSLSLIKHCFLTYHLDREREGKKWHKRDINIQMKAKLDLNWS